MWHNTFLCDKTGATRTVHAATFDASDRLSFERYGCLKTESEATRCDNFLLII